MKNAPAQPYKLNLMLHFLHTQLAFSDKLTSV